MTDIVRVWGSCDKIQVEFKYEGGKQWSCTVPPDLEDGIYVAEFWAQDEKGRIGHWSGFLYMVNGICHFKFNQEKYQIWLHPNRYFFEIDKENRKYKFGYKKEEKKDFIFEITKENYQTFFDTSNYKILIEKTNDFELEFVKDIYSFEFCKEKKNYQKREIKNSNLIQRLLLHKQAQQLSTSFTAKLGTAILGFMKLGVFKDENEENNDYKTSYYQIDFKTDKDLYIETNSKYEIIIKKRCEHWEP